MTKEIVIKEEKKIIKRSDLNPKQEFFCQLYTGVESKDFFGNGTLAYLEAYDLDQSKYKTAMVNASKLLRNAKIIKKINTLLEAEGFSDENVDKQHLFLLNQHADLKTKMSAIKEYNAIKGRLAPTKSIVEGKVEHTQNTENYKEIQEIKSKFEDELSKTLRNVVSEQ